MKFVLFVNIRRRRGSPPSQSVGQAELPRFPQSGDCGYHRFRECLLLFDSKSFYRIVLCRFTTKQTAFGNPMRSF